MSSDFLNPASINASIKVLLPVFNGYEAVQSCLYSLLADGLDPAISELIIIDDASTDVRIAELLKNAQARAPDRVTIRTNPYNYGYLKSLNDCFCDVSGAIILLNSDTVVCPGWASRMLQGAKRYPRLAMLTPLSNNATFSTIDQPSLLGIKVDRSDLAPIQAFCAARAGVGYPIAPTGMGFCLLVTELARSLVTGFDELFEPGYEEENDMAQRLRAHGLQCRIATDVFIYHQGGESFGAEKLKLQQSHYQLIQKRHPSYDAMIKEWFFRLDYPFDLVGHTDRKCIKILIDCEVMRQSMTGVVRYLTTLLDCFESPSQQGLVSVTALLTDHQTRDYWQPRYQWVNWILEDELGAFDLYPEYDIYHLVNANLSLDRLLSLRRRACRLVITLHDLIAYENLSYFELGSEYIAYRHRLRLMVALSDVVLAISPQTESDAFEQLGISGQRCKLFSNPLLHLRLQSADHLRSALPTADRPFCLIVGTDFRHKHVPATVEIFRDVVLPSQPLMRLVIAGPSVESGGTGVQLKAMLEKDSMLAAAVEIMGPVSDASLQLLYQQASLCLYLSLQEGFGYIPYEAACWGCPTVVADTSVFSSCPDFVAISPYCCPSTLNVIRQLLSDPKARERNVAFWRDRITDDQQREPGLELLSIYQQALSMPRDTVAETLVEVLAGPVEGANSILAQSDLKRAVRSVSKRVLSAARRKLRFRLQRLTGV